MKFKVLTDKESKDLIGTYYTLCDLIDKVHAESIAILEKKYQEYLQNFNPKILWIFTRTQLTFEQFISGIDDLGHISIIEHSGKKYLDVTYFYTPKSIDNVIKLSDKENALISAACDNGLDIFRKHNTYINRLVRYAAQPLELENSDFDNFDKYKRWSCELKEAWDNYNQVP